MKCDSFSIVDLVSELSKSLCILAGAGISYPPPSSLPTAFRIMEFVASHLPLSASERAELLASFSPEWGNGVGYFDYLRFEQVISAIQRSIDPGLELIDVMIPESLPNVYHYQLASLIKQGHMVMTTNFDCLIERACYDRGVLCTVIVTEDDYARYRTNQKRIMFPLFKLHGTQKERISNESRKVSANIEAVLAERTLLPNKWAIVDKILGERDLLVIGYSGSDDFDVMPAILFVPHPRRILWIQHHEESNGITKM